MTMNRWTVARNNTEILCHLGMCYIMKPIDSIGDASVAIFGSAIEAAAIGARYIIDFDDGNYEVVPVCVRIEFVM